MGRAIIISNRVIEPSGVTQAGGVGVALANIVDSTDGVWIGWDGTIDDCQSRSESQIVGSRLTSPLTKGEHHGFYLGYSNSVLWPVFHTRLDLAEFEAGYFSVYKSVNARFAKMVAEVVQPDDTIWVHDYQFILIGLELRKLGVRNPIGFFLHIPFPPQQSFQSIPEHRELARGLAAYDLVGLQTSADVSNLLSYLQHIQGRLVPDGRVRVFDRLISVQRFPIGIDPADFDVKPTGKSPRLRPELKHLIGVDRLDYTKGLPQKFRAFRKFLDMAPQYRKRVVLNQIAPPTRESVEAYADIRKELESLSGSINGTFGEFDWVPIHYLHRSVARLRLAEIYRASDVALVTPLRDGMNLVAKEFVAAQDPANPGVLILSQFAGAAEELKAALIVNPYNLDEVAEAILTALEMPLEERVTRNASLRRKVLSQDVSAWATSFLTALRKLATEAKVGLAIDTPSRIAQAMGRLRSASPIRPPPPASLDRKGC